MIKAHSFHIPVMGIAFTIDTPLKVSQYGIDSVISLGDDILLEKLRKFYCEKFAIPYDEITNKIEDFRAKRITSYLNLMNDLAENKFEELKNSLLEKGNGLKEYFNTLPINTNIKKEFKNLTAKCFDLNEISEWINDNLSMGSIDVNIMTKVDKENYVNDELLPTEYNDAHAALRGFANSDLASSVVLSAGMSPRLYGYFEQFEDFYHNEEGVVKKKIILKVSDYRSALIQGKYFAKKGLWVSEYRIESGLNCGGHAFATDGYLLGPILAEFKENRDELNRSVHEVLIKALELKGRPIPNAGLSIKISAQGGVGTAEEHQFLIDHYQIDSVGWGSPFLLVPEATTVDEHTIDQLKEATEEDLYLSTISPLGVPFNNLRRNTKDLEKDALIEKGRPGSSCPKRYLALNKEFTEKALCPGSRQYQKLKLDELDKEGLTPEEYKKKFDQVTDISCICVGLGTSALLVNGLDTRTEGGGVSICPGPNMAYFSKTMSLAEITDHIYGKSNMITRTDRPNMFIKELGIYLNYLQDQIKGTSTQASERQKKYLKTFAENLKEGISYYYDLFRTSLSGDKDPSTNALNELDKSTEALHLLSLEIEEISTSA